MLKPTAQVRDTGRAWRLDAGSRHRDVIGSSSLGAPDPCPAAGCRSFLLPLFARQARSRYCSPNPHDGRSTLFENIHGRSRRRDAPDVEMLTAFAGAGASRSIQASVPYHRLRRQPSRRVSTVSDDAAISRLLSYTGPCRGWDGTCCFYRSVRSGQPIA